MRTTTPLRAARQLRGLKQTELCERLEKIGHPLGQSGLSKLERAVTQPAPATAAALARVLDFPAETLFPWPSWEEHEHVKGAPLAHFKGDCGHEWISDLTGSYACPACGRADGDHHLTELQQVDWPLVTAKRIGERGSVAAPLPASALPLVLR